METYIYGADGAGRGNRPPGPLPLLPNRHLPAKPHAAGEHCIGDSCLACKNYIRHYIESINWMVFSDGQGSPPPFSITTVNICDMIQSLWRHASQKQQLTNANTVAMAAEIAYLRQQLEIQRQELEAIRNPIRTFAEGSVQVMSAMPPSSLNGAFPFLPTAPTMSHITARDQVFSPSTMGHVPSSGQVNLPVDQSVLAVPSTPNVSRSIGADVDTVTQLLSALPIQGTPMPNAPNMFNTINASVACRTSTQGPFASDIYSNPTIASSSKNYSQYIPSIEELDRASTRMYKISTPDGRLHVNTFTSSEHLSHFSPTASESDSRKRLRNEHSDSEGENASLAAPPGSSKRPRTGDGQFKIETAGTETALPEMDREDGEGLTASTIDAGRPGLEMLTRPSMSQSNPSATQGTMPYCAEGPASGSASNGDGSSQVELASSLRPAPPQVANDEVVRASDRPQLTIEATVANTHQVSEEVILQTEASHTAMPAEMRSLTADDSAHRTAPSDNPRPVASETLSSRQTAPTTGAETNMARVAIENSTRLMLSGQRPNEEGTRRLLPPRPPIPSPFRNVLPRSIRAEASATTDIFRDRAAPVMPSAASRLPPSTQNLTETSVSALTRTPTEASGQQRDVPSATSPEMATDLATSLRRYADLDSTGRGGSSDVAQSSGYAAGGATVAAANGGNNSLITGRHRPKPPVSYQTRNARQIPASTRRNPVHDPGFVIYQDPEPPANHQRPQSSQQRLNSERRTRGRPIPTGIENTPPIPEESSDSSPEPERRHRSSTRR